MPRCWLNSKGRLISECIIIINVSAKTHCKYLMFVKLPKRLFTQKLAQKVDLSHLKWGAKILIFGLKYQIKIYVSLVRSCLPLYILHVLASIPFVQKTSGILSAKMLCTHSKQFNWQYLKFINWPVRNLVGWTGRALSFFLHHIWQFLCRFQSVYYFGW